MIHANYARDDSIRVTQRHLIGLKPNDMSICLCEALKNAELRLA